MRGYMVVWTRWGVVREIEPVFLQTLLTGGGQQLIGQAKLSEIAAGVDVHSETFIRQDAAQITDVITRS